MKNEILSNFVSNIVEFSFNQNFIYRKNNIEKKTRKMFIFMGKSPRLVVLKMKMKNP
jgi:hypothetical protein